MNMPTWLFWGVVTVLCVMIAYEWIMRRLGR